VLGLVAACSGVIASVHAEQDAAEQPLEVDFTGILAVPWTDDLDGMAERTAIRIATTFSRTHFFLDQGVPRGSTQEVVTAFERFLRQRGGALAGVRTILIPMSRDELLNAVIDGRADIAAANLTITPSRAELVAFSTPFSSRVLELPVSGPTGPILKSLDDLAGRSVYVRRSSSYYESLQRLSADMTARGLAAPDIVLVDELLETEDILELVSAGAFPLTIADSSLTGLWGEILPDLKVYVELPVSEPRQIAWAMRKESPALLEAVNAFVGENRQGTLLGNILIKRYLQDNRWVRNPLREEETSRLEALRELFQTYAQEYGFDWLLSAAQAYQESGLDHSVVSNAGAVGVMQLLPSTAADPKVGIPDISSIESNINAGIKYKRFLLDRYFDAEEIAPLDRFLFTLAAYNAGPARVNEYRGKAAQRGLDPNRWFRHVEQVSNRETMNYVSNIYKYYLSYQEYQRRLAVLEQEKADALRNPKAATAPGR